MLLDVSDGFFGDNTRVLLFSLIAILFDVVGKLPSISNIFNYETIMFLTLSIPVFAQTIDFI